MSEEKKKGKRGVGPLRRQRAELMLQAERIYRRYCRGDLTTPHAFAHVVKTLEFQGDNHTIDEIRRWAKQGRWDEKVKTIDAAAYAAMHRSRHLRDNELSAEHYSDLMAVKAAVLEMQDLSVTLLAKAGGAIENMLVETPSEALQVARTGQMLLESSVKLREALAKFVPEQAKDVTATVDGRPVEGQILNAATTASPNLAAAVAQFERAAREGKKH